MIARVQHLGVAEFVVCGGSRNAPLVVALADSATISFFDERSAAFFALGRIKRDGKPVAVVTTSGTAVAELLPATVESYYAGAPLVLITADRPARFRGSGAPQAVEQVGIFGPYAATSIEQWDRGRPLHLNVEFDEPLIDE
jgi:2-succinyl-5-enolpyruvyl-6-hydroxy-3-cyclohexene-1-carboxylate synthase